MSACTDQWTGFSSSELQIQNHTSRAKLILAFGAVWFFWGSTYLAITKAVTGVPPFLMTGARWFTAGSLLYIYVRLIRGAARPERSSWATALLGGGLLFLAGNGTLAYVLFKNEHRQIYSIIAALFIATEPLWVVLLNWWWPGGVKPQTSKFVGIALGLFAAALLWWRMPVQLTYAPLLIMAAFFWAFGSIVSSKARVAASSLMLAAMQMLMGGALALLFGLIRGEIGQMQERSSLRVSIFALCYLIVCGSLLAFCSYNWLLKVTTPSRASSFAYVNPMVALGVGWSLSRLPWLATKLGGPAESSIPLDFSFWLAAALIVAAVAIVTGNWSWKNGGQRNPMQKEKS